METNYLLLTFKRNDGEMLQMGCGCVLKIISIKGIESAQYTLHTSSGATEHGSFVSGKKIEERSISITFGIDDQVNRETYRKQVIQFFNPLDTFTLQLNWCYRQAQIQCEVSSFNFTDIQSMWDILEGNLELLCPYPFWEDLDNFGRNIASITPQWAYPVVFLNEKSAHHELGKIYGYRTFRKDVELPNKGDVPTGIIIRFTATRGAVKKPKIIKVSTGEFIEVLADLKKGDVLEINTNKGSKGVTLNGENISRKINKLSTYFEIDQKNNVIRYDAAENYTNLDVFLYYQSKYLGI